MRPVDVDSPLLDAVIALGDANKATLGLIPREVYRQRAAGGTLLAAVIDTGVVVGYALYEIARGRVRLVHLCGDVAFRGRGAARLLVDHITEAHPGPVAVRRSQLASRRFTLSEVRSTARPLSRQLPPRGTHPRNEVLVKPRT